MSRIVLATIVLVAAAYGALELPPKTSSMLVHATKGHKGHPEGPKTVAKYATATSGNAKGEWCEFNEFSNDSTFTWAAAYSASAGQWMIHGLWPGTCQFSDSCSLTEPTGQYMDYVMDNWLPNQDDDQYALFKHEWCSHGRAHWQTVNGFIETVASFKQNYGDPICNSTCSSPSDGQECKFTCTNTGVNGHVISCSLSGSVDCNGSWNS